MAACGAKTRAGGPCKRASLANGRCNLHGGKATGAPKGNQNATKWGFWSRRVTPEQLALMQELDSTNPADILWYNILLSYSAIIRAQSLMWVQDANDHSDFGQGVNAQRQWAWDKHAAFMAAQARAQAELRGLIKEFVALADEQDARRQKLALLQAELTQKQLEIERLRNPGGESIADDGFLEALRARIPDVWEEAPDGDTAE